MLRAGATGKGREGDKSPSQGLGRKGFMILSTEPLHALRLSASADFRISFKIGGTVVRKNSKKNFGENQAKRNGFSESPGLEKLTS